ncbi:hypothetical protein CSUI_006588, partial [Cystoisospora suis]
CKVSSTGASGRFAQSPRPRPAVNRTRPRQYRTCSWQGNTSGGPSSVPCFFWGHSSLFFFSSSFPPRRCYRCSSCCTVNARQHSDLKKLAKH